MRTMRKVTIGCKGDSGLKWELTQEAEEARMSLSEYMEIILENRHMQDDVKMLRYRLKEEQRSKQQVLSRLEEYENALDNHFRYFKGKELNYEQDGRVTKRKVLTKQDILECLLSAVKIEQ